MVPLLTLSSSSIALYPITVPATRSARAVRRPPFWGSRGARRAHWRTTWTPLGGVPSGLAASAPRDTIASLRLRCRGMSINAASLGNCMGRRKRATIT